jgi:hypothetical protein
MKKILLLLFSVLFTMSIYGQTDATIDYSQVNTVTQVGDTLTVKFNYGKAKDANGADIDATLYQFDLQYNSKLLNKISTTWQTTSTSAQKAINSWNGYKFSVDSNKNNDDFDGQYLSWLSSAASYTSNSDWSVDRITYQDVTALGDGDEIIKVDFIIKDKANSNYSDYSNLLNANWVNFKESDGTQIGVGKGASSFNLSLSNIQGGDAGNVTLSLETNVITNNIGDGTDFTYTIYAKGDTQTSITSGQFDASGDATITGLENDVEYDVYISIDDQKTYLDDVVTVSDLALVFAEAIGAGDGPNGISTTFDYYLQSILANVVGTSIPDGGDINFDDSYEILAYLQGVTSTNTTYITKTGNAYNISGRKSTYGDDVNGIATVSPTFKPTDSNKSFTYVHGLSGDVNFSHGFEPTSTDADIPTSAQSTMASSMRVSMAPGQKYQSEEANIDLVSELKDGQVIFSINSDIAEMIGAQFNIIYDKTRLVLDNVIFDTGNEMTNFSNHLEEDGKINIGSFDQNFEAVVKTGTPYQLIFTPTVTLSNTSGLITFKVNEGVKADGTQIKFIME